MQAKKSLGQNFLNSPSAVAKIISASEITEGETILEAGPGKGVLTEALLKAGAKVIAVEKDDELIPYLQEKFAREISEGNFTLVHGDVLEFDPLSRKLRASSYKLVANIPYYITGIFLRKFLSEAIQPNMMVLMLQKEVAERIVARDKKESILSISVKVYGEPVYIQTVKAGSFIPPPTVDSAILLIKNISKNYFADFGESQFFELLKVGFSSKRKMVLGNMKKIKNVPAPLWQELFEKAGIGPKARAEDLSAETWQKLNQIFKKRREEADRGAGAR